MSPLAVLGRGYAVARNADGKILRSARNVSAGDRVDITLGDGGFTAVVDKPYEKEEQP
jgi:exodeoxyribonuclease VII large subunit